MNISGVEHTASLLQTLGQPARLQILLAIGVGETCVCHLEAALGWRQAYLSQHLMALRRAGILLARREGRFMHYRMADPRILAALRSFPGGDSLPDLSPSRGCRCAYCTQDHDEAPA